MDCDKIDAPDDAKRPKHGQSKGQEAVTGESSDRMARQYDSVTLNERHAVATLLALRAHIENRTGRNLPRSDGSPQIRRMKRRWESGGAFEPKRGL